MASPQLGLPPRPVGVPHGCARPPWPRAWRRPQPSPPPWPGRTAPTTGRAATAHLRTDIPRSDLVRRDRDGRLPASWVGTWKGTGPGSASGDGVVNARTNKVSVTVTLHATSRGDIVGRQVSHVTAADSGQDIGCTETLRLRETHMSSMVFEAATSTPTDPSNAALCMRGNIYTLTKTGTNTLSLGDEGSQTEGAPSRLTRSS